MAKIDKLRDRWQRVGNLSQLAEALDKSEDFEDSFKGYWSDFVEYLQTEHKDMDKRLVEKLPAADIKSQLDFSRDYLQNERTAALKYGIKNLEEIVDNLDDDGRFILTTSVLPIRNVDMNKTGDLDKLIDEYKENLDTLKKNLGTINNNSSDAEKERYNVQKLAIKEHEEFVSLLQNNKELVKNVIGYRVLESYMGGKDEKPNEEKMRQAYFSQLDGILNDFKEDKDKFADNIGVIQTLKYLSKRDPNFLVRQYVESILKPAQDKLREVIGKYSPEDLKDYLKRNVDVMNTNKQIGFLNTVCTRC